MTIDVADLQEQLRLQRQRVDVDHFDVTIRELVRMSGTNTREMLAGRIRRVYELLSPSA